MKEGKSKLLQAIRVVRRKIHSDVREQLADETKTYQEIADAIGCSHTPSLDNAVETWCAARHAYQSEPRKNHLDAYNAASFELGQAFTRWQAEQPELFEQFRFWLIAHLGA